MHYRASDQSPSTVVSASSPEVDLQDYIKREKEGLPGLRLISMDEGLSSEEKERECKSPEIPVQCPVPVKGKMGINSRTIQINPKCGLMQFKYP